LTEVKMPNTKFQILVKQLRHAIKEYSKTNKIGAKPFEDLLEETVDEYNNRDNLTFVSKVAGETIDGIQGVVDDKIGPLTDKLIELMGKLRVEKESFEKLGITFEEKAFYDVLINVRDNNGFDYDEEKCIELSRKIKELVDGTTVYVNWNDNQTLKNDLTKNLSLLLYKNKYPKEWREEAVGKILEQVENYTSNR